MSSREHLRCCRYYETAAEAADRRLGGAVSAPPEVSGTLLGSKARYAPDRDFDTVHVRIELDCDLKRRSASGSVRTTLRALAHSAKTVRLRAAGMKILDVREGDKKLVFKHKEERLTIKLSESLSQGEETAVTVRYRINAPKCGLHFAPAEGSGPATQMWSQGQPEDAHYWFPCHDAPHEKATTEVIATVPKGFVAASNGELYERRERGSKEIFHWRMDQPHSLYLVCLSVGRFSVIEDRWEDVPVVYYAEKGREEDAKRGFSKTVAAMDILSRKLGVRYPYPRYAQVAASEFPGGMENTTCTTQTDACLVTEEAALDHDLDLLVSHELAHHWFGDLITCRDWSHAWLNEGFATYCEMIFTEEDKGRDEADHELEFNRRNYLHEDSSRYRRAIVSRNYRYPWVLFDRHLYEKGGWVLHMLRAELGETDWWNSLRHYLQKHRNESVETSDLIVAIEEATGRNLRGFFDQWVFSPGYPVFDVRYSWDSKKKSATLTVKQNQGTGGGTPTFDVPVVVRFTGKNGRWTKEIRERIHRKKSDHHFKLPEEPAMVEFDAEHTVLKRLTMQKPHPMWLAELKGARTGVSRSRAAWQVARWGDAAAVRALEASARADDFWGTAAEAAKALGTIRTDESFRALKRLLKVRHPKVRRAVVGSIAGLGRPEAASLLAPLITKDKSLQVKGEAIRALGQTRDPKWARRIKSQLNRKSYWDFVPGAAVNALASLKDASHLPLLRRLSKTGSYPLRVHAVRAVASFYPVKPEVLEWVCEAALAKDERVALQAIQSLGSLGDPRALETLEKAREAAHDTRIMAYAEEAMARIKKESV
jgi:aminopeptidase N